MKNVETINLRVAVSAATDGADAVDMDNFAGATTLNLDRTVGANDVKDVSLKTNVNFLNSDATMDTTVTWKSSGVTGSSDAATLTLTGVNKGADIELAGDVETITLNASGSASTLADLVLDAQTTALVINADEKFTVETTYTAAGVKALTVTGDSLVKIVPTLAAATVSVDASAQTAGGTNVILGASSTFKGGAGDDVVDSTLSTTKSVSGGEGNDTIVFTASTNYLTSAAKADGFEVLRGSGVGASYNVAALTGINAIEAYATGGTLTFTGMGTQGVRVGNDITTLVTTLSNATGKSDALTFTIDDVDTTAGAITIGDISAAGVETINIVTGDALSKGTAHTVSDFDSSTSVKTLNVSGDSDLTLSDIADFASKATVNAADFTHILTVAGVGSGDTIKAGSGDDAIDVAFGNLGTSTVISGGAGDDTLTVSGNGSDIVDGDFAQISGIDNLTISSATTTDVTFAGYAQAAIQTVDKNTDGRLDVTAASLTATSAIDASTLISAGVDISVTLTIGDGAGDQTLTLSGGNIADTITIVAVDTADAGGDDDIDTTVNGGNGIDVIKYTLTNGDADDVLTVVSSATTVANADIITGFASAHDFYDYNGSLSNGTATTDDVAATLAAGIASNAAAGTYIITTNIADSGSNTSGAAFATLLASTADNLSANFDALKDQLAASGGIFNGAITGLDAAIATDESALLVIDNGTGSAVMRFVNSSATGNLVSVDEIQLVAVFTNTAAFAAGDIV